MKILLSALSAAAVLSASSVAFAAPATTTTTTCTSSSKSADVPSGTYSDAGGRQWAGFKANGMPPDSLSSDSTSISCDTVVVTTVPV
jgi:hypothetical protein